MLLVAQLFSMTLIKVAADEAAESWQVTGSLAFSPLGKAPVCSVFRDDGERAYVSLRPSGIAIVDVPTMQLLGTLETDGFVACGMIKSKRGRIVTVASSGGGGHLYRLDTATDALTDAGTLGADDWHSFNMSPNEKVGFGTSPHSDEIIVADLTGPVAGLIGAVPLDPTPGAGNDEPERPERARQHPLRVASRIWSARDRKGQPANHDPPSTLSARAVQPRDVRPAASAAADWKRGMCDPRSHGASVTAAVFRQPFCILVACRSADDGRRGLPLQGTPN